MKILLIAVLAVTLHAQALLPSPAGGGGGGGGSTTPGGSNTQLQYNNSSAFGGITGATSNGTTVTLTSPNLTTPHVTTILDGNGNPFIISSATTSAVDSITITNAATANPAMVTLAPSGSDSNVGLTLVAKGGGVLTFTAPHLSTAVFDGNGAATTATFLQSGSTLAADFVNQEGFGVWGGRGITTSDNATHDTNQLQNAINTFGIQTASNLVIGFNASAHLNGDADTAISRISAAKMAIGNGTAGDHSGTMQAATIIIDNASFTLNGHTCSIVSTVLTCP